MITLEQFKNIARIDFDNDDDELQLYLDGAIEYIENYTNYSLKEKTLTKVSNGCPIEFYGAPVINITGSDRVDNEDFSVLIYAKRGDTVTIELGVNESPLLESCVYSLALSMYETKEMYAINLPVDLQFKINKFRRDSFLD
ncbi:Phage gp6-like head-tail connector protein [compost metagenome]